MAARRCSRLQKRLLAWLAMDEQQTRGMISRSHQELVGALQGDKGNISQSLHTLEARGLLGLVRSHGGKADSNCKFRDQPVSSVGLSLDSSSSPRIMKSIK